MRICIEPRKANLALCRFAGMQFGRKLITSRTVIEANEQASEAESLSRLLIEASKPASILK